jgi:hypothetical protein
MRVAAGGGWRVAGAAHAHTPTHMLAFLLLAEKLRSLFALCVPVRLQPAARAHTLPYTPHHPVLIPPVRHPYQN